MKYYNNNKNILLLCSSIFTIEAIYIIILNEAVIFYDISFP